MKSNLWILEESKINSIEIEQLEKDIIFDTMQQVIIKEGYSISIADSKTKEEKYIIILDLYKGIYHNYILIDKDSVLDVIKELKEHQFSMEQLDQRKHENTEKCIITSFKENMKTWGMTSGTAYIKDILEDAKNQTGYTKKYIIDVIKTMSDKKIIELTRYTGMKNIKIGNYNVCLLRVL